MKIAFLADFYPPLNRGGAGIVVQRLAQFYATNGHDVLVIATAQEQRHSGTQNDGAVRVVRIPARYPERLRNFLGVHNPPAVRRLRRDLAAFAPDVVHAHNVHHYLSFGALGAAARLGLPVVLTSHDFLLFCCDRLPCASGPRDFLPRWHGCMRCQRFRYNPLRRPLIRRIVRSAVREILAISDLMRRALLLNGFDRVSTVHNGIDPGEWPVGTYSSRIPGSAAGPPTVLLPGRLSSFKGTEALLDAVARIPAAERPVVVFAGDNPRYEPSLRAYAKALGITQNIVITGWLDEPTMRQTVSEADVVVTPSTYPDPFNLGNIEAMSAGRPVIASSLGGGPEIVVHGETGFIVDPANAEEFAGKLALLLGDPDLRRRFGLAGRARVLSHFTLQRQAVLTMDCYLRAVPG